MDARETSPAAEETVQGLVQRKIYSAEGGFAILTMRLESGIPLTLLGELAGIEEGTYLCCRGHYQENPAYGRQFRVRQWQISWPRAGRGVIAFLAGGLFPHIGPKRAARIYAAFGEEALKVLERDPQQLVAARLLPASRLPGIIRAWKKVQGQARLRSDLAATGLGPALTEALLRHYPQLQMEQLRQDPYRILGRVPRLGFIRCDRLALALGVSPQDRQRIAAALKHLLAEAEGGGDLFVEEAQLRREAGTLLGIPEERVGAVLNQESGGAEMNLIREELEGRGIIYSRPAWLAECRAAADLRRLKSAPSGLPPLEVERGLAWAQGRLQVTLSGQQRQALRLALQQKLVLLTGGPGTGKTTGLRALVAILQKKQIPFALAAPTGRAARRMSQAAGAAASTLHRLLEYNPLNNRFQRGEKNRLELAMMVVDECSMLDQYLFAALLQALPSRCHLLLVGDAQQLPSVGPGQVLSDLLRSGCLPRVELTRIFRQGTGSAIAAAAQRVNCGQMPRSGGEFQIELVENEEESLERLEGHLRRLAATGLDLPRAVQILTPVNRGPLGTEALNQRLQVRLNPGGPATFHPLFRSGDKIAQLRNNYRDEIFNGEVGQVLGQEEGRLRLGFDSREVRYSPADLEDVALAYAMSVHKAQGSEYPAVIVLLPQRQDWFLQRRLLYTAITRACHELVLISSRRALQLCLSNRRQAWRRSLLWRRISEPEAWAWT